MAEDAWCRPASPSPPRTVAAMCSGQWLSRLSLCSPLTLGHLHPCQPLVPTAQGRLPGLVPCVSHPGHPRTWTPRLPFWVISKLVVTQHCEGHLLGRAQPPTWPSSSQSPGVPPLPPDGVGGGGSPVPHLCACVLEEGVWDPGACVRSCSRSAPRQVRWGPASVAGTDVGLGHPDPGMRTEGPP